MIFFSVIHYYFVIVSLLFRYNFVINSLLFRYYFVIILLLFRYYFFIISLLFRYYFVIISLLFRYYFVIISLLLCYYWSPVENRRPIKSLLSVCVCVRPSVTAFLRNRSKDFSEIWHEVRHPYGLGRSAALFFLK